METSINPDQSAPLKQSELGIHCLGISVQAFKAVQKLLCYKMKRKYYTCTKQEHWQQSWANDTIKCLIKIFTIC